MSALKKISKVGLYALLAICAVLQGAYASEIDLKVQVFLFLIILVLPVLFRMICSFRLSSMETGHTAERPLRDPDLFLRPFSHQSALLRRKVYVILQEC